MSLWSGRFSYIILKVSLIDVKYFCVLHSLWGIKLFSPRCLENEGPGVDDHEMSRGWAFRVLNGDNGTRQYTSINPELKHLTEWPLLSNAAHVELSVTSVGRYIYCRREVVRGSVLQGLQYSSREGGRSRLEHHLCVSIFVNSGRSCRRTAVCKYGASLFPSRRVESLRA